MELSKTTKDLLLKAIEKYKKWEQTATDEEKYEAEQWRQEFYRKFGRKTSAVNSPLSEITFTAKPRKIA